MELKSLLSLAALMATAASFAVTSKAVLCRIEVDSGTQSTILSLPLESVGTTTPNQIAVTDLVMTDNLVDGDTMMVVCDDQTYGWILENGAWKGAITVNGTTTSEGAEANKNLNRGDAIWVNRTGTGAEISKPFYLYGQIATDNTDTIMSQEMGKATTKMENDKTIVPAFTLVGNPNPADVDINSLTWTNVGTDDQIVWGRADGLGVNIWEYKNNKWGYNKTVTTVVTVGGKELTKVDFEWTSNDLTLPAGQGFWYVSKTISESEVAAPKVSWSSNASNQAE